MTGLRQGGGQSHIPPPARDLPPAGHAPAWLSKGEGWEGNPTLVPPPFIGPKIKGNSSLILKN